MSSTSSRVNGRSSTRDCSRTAMTSRRVGCGAVSRASSCSSKKAIRSAPAAFRRSWSAACIRPRFHFRNRSAWSCGSPTMSRNTLFCKGSARSVSSSHEPLARNRSISRTHSCRIRLSIPATAFGENSGSRSRRYLPCSGGSSSAGIIRRGHTGVAEIETRSLENSSVLRSTARMSAERVSTQYPPSAGVQKMRSPRTRSKARNGSVRNWGSRWKSKSRTSAGGTWSGLVATVITQPPAQLGSGEALPRR